MEKTVEKRMEDEEIEEKVVETTVNTVSNEIKWYMHQEHLLDISKVLANGFIGCAISRAELKDMLTAKPNSSYPVAVMKFLGFLDT